MTKPETALYAYYYVKSQMGYTFAVDVSDHRDNCPAPAADNPGTHEWFATPWPKLAEAELEATFVPAEFCARCGLVRVMAP